MLWSIVVPSAARKPGFVVAVEAKATNCALSCGLGIFPEKPVDKWLPSAFIPPTAGSQAMHAKQLLIARTRQCGRKQIGRTDETDSP
jgi:hypothetical protein